MNYNEKFVHFMDTYSISGVQLAKELDTTTVTITGWRKGSKIPVNVIGHLITQHNMSAQWYFWDTGSMKAIGDNGSCSLARQAVNIVETVSEVVQEQTKGWPISRFVAVLVYCFGIWSDNASRVFPKEEISKLIELLNKPEGGKM